MVHFEHKIFFLDIAEFEAYFVKLCNRRKTKAHFFVCFGFGTSMEHFQFNI